MSHLEQLAFFQAVADKNHHVISAGRVIEIGSFDVNGTVRSIFDSRVYTGVDLVEGPGVDVVRFGHEVDEPDGSFDVAISGECFEHDPHWRQTFLNMTRLTRAGGLVAFTCASTGRPEHGTRRTRVRDSPGTQIEGIDYYRNLSESDFSDFPLDALFSQYRFWYMPTTFDLYFAGVRHGVDDAQLPDEASIAKIRSLMGWQDRLLRLPLRFFKRIVPEERYQAVVLPYWIALLKIQDIIGRSEASYST